MADLTTQNTNKAEQAVLKAARAKFGRRKSLHIRPVFEHGHWWIIVDDHDKDVDEGQATFDVVNTNNGLDFEQV